MSAERAYVLGMPLVTRMTAEAVGAVGFADSTYAISWTTVHAAVEMVQ